MRTEMTPLLQGGGVLSYSSRILCRAKWLPLRQKTASTKKKSHLQAVQTSRWRVWEKDGNAKSRTDLYIIPEQCRTTQGCLGRESRTAFFFAAKLRSSNTHRELSRRSRVDLCRCAVLTIIAVQSTDVRSILLLWIFDYKETEPKPVTGITLFGRVLSWSGDAFHGVRNALHRASTRAGTTAPICVWQLVWFLVVHIMQGDCLLACAWNSPLCFMFWVVSFPRWWGLGVHVWPFLFTHSIQQHYRWCLKCSLNHDLVPPWRGGNLAVERCQIK